jgi:hypothetical protein
MPLVGTKCCQTGEDTDFEYCLGCARTGEPKNCQYPLPLIKFMAGKEKHREGIGLSATGIISCARQNVLLRENDYYESPGMFRPLFQGEVWHRAVEAYLSDEHDMIVETRFERDIEVDGELFTLSGMPDQIMPDRALITDVKRVNRKVVCDDGEGKHDSYCLRKPYPEHEQQINIYAWLIRDGRIACPPNLRDQCRNSPIRIRIDKGGIVYEGNDGSKKLSVSIWTDDEQESFVRERLRPLVRYEGGGPLPELLPATVHVARASGRPYVKRHWKCDRCPVRAICDARAMEETGLDPNQADYWKVGQVDG